MLSTFRQAARQASSTRAFASSAVSRKDLVQDLYLREIKAYKPAPAVSTSRRRDFYIKAKDAHVGVVKKFSLPPAPKTPALPSDLASELAAYDAAEPAAAAAAAPVAQASPTSADEPAGGADGFLAFLEQDLPKPVHHH
ncbi:ATP synthase complex subunit H-domain-containing protein [Flammula alnicola]|nr:ATP synthase complex subunit H-domain-containing protein [Flammula alnicola]